jgi:hypothetical protein
MIRSGFKTSDQVQGQGAERAGKRSIHGYVSIYRRSATRPLGLRWGFETISTGTPTMDKPMEFGVKTNDKTAKSQDDIS